jgi:hypothetical protein
VSDGQIANQDVSAYGRTRPVASWRKLSCNAGAARTCLCSPRNHRKHDERLFLFVAAFVNDGGAALLSEGRIGQDHLVFVVFTGERGFGEQGIGKDAGVGSCQPVPLPALQEVAD